MAVAFVSTPAATIKAAASSGSFASFSPNAGSGYLVVVSAGTNQSGVAATTVAWASGGSGTWAKLKSFNFNQFQPTIEIWAVHCSTAPGASVISVTGNAFVTSIHAPIREMTGHDTTLPTTGGTATGTSATGTIACTPNSTGSRIVVGALDVNEGFTATPNAATTMLDSFNNGGAESYACYGTSNTTASTAQTLGVTNTLTGNIQLALEILPSTSTNYTQTATDSSGTTDATAQTAAYARPATDSAGLTDLPSQASTAARAVTDSTGATDLLASATSYARTITDSAGLTDPATSVQAAARALTDDAGSTDQDTGYSAAYSETLIDSAGLTDSTVQSGSNSYAQTITDAAGLADAAVQATTVVRSLTDPAGSTDTTAQVSAATRALTDSTGSSDLVSQTSSGAGTQTNTDDAGLGDNVTQAVNYQITITDSAGLTDLVAKEYGRILTDLAGLTDTSSQAAASQRQVIDDAGARDTVIQSGANLYSYIFTDDAGLVDVLTQPQRRDITLTSAPLPDRWSTSPLPDADRWSSTPLE